MDYTVKVTDTAIQEFVEGQNYFLRQLRHDLCTQSREVFSTTYPQGHLNRIIA